MIEDEFPSNSQKAQPPGAKKVPEKNIKRVTKGEAGRRKRPVGKRFKETFFGGDAREAVSSTRSEVVVPAVKQLILDAGFQILELMVVGESRGRRPWRSGGGIVHTAYNRMSNNVNSNNAPWQRPDPRREVSNRGRATHNFDEIVLDSRGEAEEVIDQLMSIVEEYSSVSVADLYAMVGITPAYTDNRYGWSELRGASVHPIRGGQYLLNLPKPQPLD